MRLRALGGVAAAQTAALGFGAVTNLLYAWLLPVEVIGRIALLLALAAALVLLADTGLQALLTRALAAGELSLPRALGAVLGPVPVLVVLWCGAAAAMSHLAGDAAGLAPLSLRSAALLAELALGLWLFQAALALLQGAGRYARRSQVVVANAGLTTAATGGLLVAWPELDAAVHATAAGYAASGGVALAALALRHGVQLVGPVAFLRLARRSRALWASSAITFATSSADVLLAGVLLPLSGVGYYHVAKKLASVALSPLTALLPVLYAQLSRLAPGARAAAYEGFQLLGTGIAAAAILAVSPFAAPLLGAAVGEEYAAVSALTVVLIGIGALAFSHNLVGYALTATGRFGPPLAINGTALALGLAAPWPLAQRFGLEGLAGALGAANAAALAVSLVVARRALPGCQRPAVAGAVLVAAATALGAWAASSPSTAVRVLGPVLAVAVLAAGALRSIRPAAPRPGQPLAEGGL